MEIDQVEDNICQIRLAGVPLSEEAADRLRALALADDLKLFVVENTAGKRAFFLARNQRFARIHALNTGHIQDLTNGSCTAAVRLQAGFASAVQRAIKDRRPGLIEGKGNHAVMGDLIYSPISVVR